jgi:hypothetical protein
MMKAGLEPWNIPLRYHRLWAECQQAECELQKREEKKMEVRRR